MSKYRFKTKEEFIRDGLWNGKYNCPDEWALEGEMDKYLGIDVPEKFNMDCDEKEEFQHDGWLFQNTDYVLKEQQEYFDDLSEIQDFLPDGHPDKIINQNFEIGKWYKWYQKNHGKYHYGKVERITTETDTVVMLPWILQCTDYNYSGHFDLSKAEQIKEISVEQVQEFLPSSHLDKITSYVFKKGEYIVLIGDGQSTGGARLVQSDQFIKNHCYKVRENSTFLRTELDSNGSTTNGWECVPYNPNQFHKTRNWRYATEKESIEYERRGKPYDVTELQKKELFMEEIQEECKKRFPIGCTYISTNKQTKILKDDSCTYIIVGKQIWAHSGGGCLYEDGEWAELVSLPEENITEVPEYVECFMPYGKAIIGKVYKTTNENKANKLFGLSWKQVLIDFGRLKYGSFKISNKEAYENQKSHIPEYIECTETQEKYFIKGNIYKVIDSTNLCSARLVSNLDFCDLKAGTSLFCSMEVNGKKYWKPSTKEAYEQQKTWLGSPEESTLDLYKGTVPNLFVYDEVVQYQSRAFDRWKEIPKFTEQKFDIYGPTSDIE